MGNSHSSQSADHTCPVHSLDENATQPLFGDTTFFTFNKILAGSCAAFACSVIFLCMFMHATHYSKPNEQSKILKIALLIPFYSIICFLSLAFPKSAVSLNPWLDFIQSISLGAFLLLVSQYVSPSSEQRDVFFATLKVKDRKSSTGKGNGLKWYRSHWMMIFQYPLVATVAAIATDITQAAGIYCEYVSKPYFAKLWINLIRTISLVLAVIAVFQFYFVLKPFVKEKRPLAKLVAFKAVVGLGFLQSIIFWILTDADVLNPTALLTYADLNIGIPNLLTCIEMVPLSLFFVYAYPWTPYLLRNMYVDDQGQRLSHSYNGGFLGIRAWYDLCNPKETIDAIVFAVKIGMEKYTNGGVGEPGGMAPRYSPLGDQHDINSGWDGGPRQAFLGQFEMGNRNN